MTTAMDRSVCVAKAGREDAGPAAGVPRNQGHRSAETDASHTRNDLQKGDLRHTQKEGDAHDTRWRNCVQNGRYSRPLALTPEGDRSRLTGTIDVVVICRLLPPRKTKS